MDPVRRPADLRLPRAFGPARCLADGLMPWRRCGGCTTVLTARPEEFARHLPDLRRRFGPVRMALAREDRLQWAIRAEFGADLARRAETRVAEEESSRSWHGPRAGGAIVLVLAALFLAAGRAPATTLTALFLVAVSVLMLSTLLKLAATVATLRPRPPPDDDRVIAASRPVVTLLVPLFREQEIAGHLLTRLAALDYPRELLDICFVLEAGDHQTRAALRRTVLPPWTRQVTVPRGVLRTKPRALNYALDTARGSVIGIYDAEDAPAPDQVSRVVARFARSRPEVACLQGVLDYYNPAATWITRCFTLDYATWFRTVLPGLARLGLVVPLGGTTLFIRRAALEDLGAWDAHNVTEDADLGLRLARRGYRTELIDTVTEEEANGRLLPWIRQRSRWLKGYAMTYAVHMRRPRQLLRDLGAWRFAGVQVLFLGTVLQFLLAPVLWTCWGLFLGLGHPLADTLAPGLLRTLALLFLAAELVSIAVTVLSARRAGKTALAFWTPALLLYFPMATLAMYRALWQMVTRPFHWDKTAHGGRGPRHARHAGARDRRHARHRHSAASTAFASILSRVT